MPDFSPGDIAVVVPTYNRPEKLRRLLQSLADQKVPPAEVVLVSAGQEVSAVAESFGASFRVKHAHLENGGQIIQRNTAIGMVSPGTRLIISFDDDIVAETDAIEQLLECWNSSPEDTAGIGLNMINESRHDSRSWQVRLKLLPKDPGRVSRAGVNSSVSAQKHSFRTQWLPGGATCWRREILETYLHRPVESKWAAYEDLMFSYPLSRNRTLVMCPRARVRHEHEFATADMRYFVARGTGTAVWRRVFVIKNRDLSTVACFVATLAQGAGLVLAGIARRAGDTLRIGWGLGMLKGAFSAVLRSILR